MADYQYSPTKALQNIVCNLIEELEEKKLKCNDKFAPKISVYHELFDYDPIFVDPTILEPIKDALRLKYNYEFRCDIGPRFRNSYPCPLCVQLTSSAPVNPEIEKARKFIFGN